MAKCSKNTVVQTINWLNIQWLRFFKTTISPNVEFETLNIQRPWCDNQLQLKNIQQNNLYPSVRSVPTIKMKDLLDLL